MRTTRDPLPARLTLAAVAHLLLLAWSVRALGGSEPVSARSQAPTVIVAPAAEQPAAR